MKRIVLTFANEALYQQAEREMMQEARQKYAANEDDVQDTFDMEEDESEIRINIKQLGD